jgi:hypothetical protein
VAYVKSLAKLTNQVAIVDAKVNMDELIKWHDQSFFQQIKEKHVYLKKSRTNQTSNSN